MSLGLFSLLGLIDSGGPSGFVVVQEIETDARYSSAAATEIHTVSVSSVAKAVEDSIASTISSTTRIDCTYEDQVIAGEVSLSDMLSSVANLGHLISAGLSSPSLSVSLSAQGPILTSVRLTTLASSSVAGTPEFSVIVEP